MYKIMSYKEVESTFPKNEYILVDVRSPGEYNSETIPGAINLPVFNDEERKIVGTAYKQEDSEEAKKLGIEFVAGKLPILYEEITKLTDKYNIFIFIC